MFFTLSFSLFATADVIMSSGSLFIINIKQLLMFSPFSNFDNMSESCVLTNQSYAEAIPCASFEFCKLESTLLDTDRNVIMQSFNKRI